jgi:glycosyltransferase involved in cell wall biosynthesis
MHKILPALDLLVHPAFMEGLGVALLQTAASGIPIVASRVGGIPEIVRDGVNGTLIPAGDPPALAQAVNDLLADTERAKVYGQAGREIVLTDFSIAAMVEGNYRVYQDVLGLTDQSGP